ncbi:Protein-L-isoaspartate(D-aspartate) O-methyltransferase [Galdieria sulphuraria]|nr:Protein-L-isoaspartate(D-aspartate) O-methyltransferase [Galdieria sulphuraria]
MAWLSRGRNQAELVKALKENGLIKTERVERTLLAVDRGHFCKYRPYEDAPQPIGWNATISAPHMHVTCLELLNEHLKPGSKALDIGSGSGYLTACMGIMVRPKGLVVGIEHIPGLAQQSLENIERSQKSLLEEGVVRVMVDDGRKGFLEGAPFDAIHVGAAAGTVPRVLLDQLAPGGRMLIPEGTSEQELVQYDKAKDGTVSKKHITFVRYVPLCSLDQQIRGI